jgi:hypothetical protein
MLASILLAAAPAAAAPLDPFVGSCWTADFTPTMRDTHCFEAMYAGAHVRDRHEVKEDGKTVYAGETIYSVEGEQAVFASYTSLGGVGRGTLGEEGPVLRFRGNMRASPGKPEQPIDSEWRIVDDDHYEVRSLVKSPSTEGNPVLRFTRVK